jgi:hypothetical protein
VEISRKILGLGRPVDDFLVNFRPRKQRVMKNIFGKFLVNF